MTRTEKRAAAAQRRAEWAAELRRVERAALAAAWAEAQPDEVVDVDQVFCRARLAAQENVGILPAQLSEWRRVVMEAAADEVCMVLALPARTPTLPVSGRR
jgi:hypothetical protein